MIKSSTTKRIRNNTRKYIFCLQEIKKQGKTIGSAVIPLSLSQKARAIFSYYVVTAHLLPGLKPRLSLCVPLPLPLPLPLFTLMAILQRHYRASLSPFYTPPQSLSPGNPPSTVTLSMSYFTINM